MSLCVSVLRIVQSEARQHGFRKVKVLRLQVGALSCVMPEAMDFCFKAVTAGTIADGARLEIVRESGAAWCMNCGETVEIGERYDPCPLCSGYELQVTRGDELRVMELEVE